MTYNNALWLGNSDIGYGGWGTFRPKWIIVHATAGDRTIENVAATFVSNKRNGNPSSTHFAVGMDGRVGQFVPEDQAAWGNGPITGPAGNGGDGVHHDAWWDGVPFGNPNSVTFSIEHCKADSANASPITDAQKQASFALIAYLCDKYGIPKRWADANGGLTGHFSMDPQNRSRCPGNYPWDELFNFLNGNTQQVTTTMSGIPSGWHDDGTTLVAPNGIPVVHGFRDRVLQGWDPNDLPLEAERHYDELSDTNPSFGSGQGQQYKGCRCIWNPQIGVMTIQLGMGDDIMFLRAQIAALKNQQPTVAHVDTSGVKHALATLDAEVAKLP